ncbi:MAG: hypothetical protein DBX55_07260 [Verrucomicrobia bacterium]|nr:MAG: hypothetical protein DBX55_07260 [Verrucomicrobiota bacterium]
MGAFSPFFCRGNSAEFALLEKFCRLWEIEKGAPSGGIFCAAVGSKTALRAISEKFGIFLQPPNAEG